MLHVRAHLRFRTEIVGKGLANLTALLLSSVVILRHMGLYEHADRIEKAAFDTVTKGKPLRGDLGGRAKTKDFARSLHKCTCNTTTVVDKVPRRTYNLL